MLQLVLELPYPLFGFHHIPFFMDFLLLRRKGFSLFLEYFGPGESRHFCAAKNWSRDPAHWPQANLKPDGVDLNRKDIIRAGLGRVNLRPIWNHPEYIILPVYRIFLVN